MAGQGQTRLNSNAMDFIQSEFSPHIAVICSSDVGRICGKNELSFVELVQPFFKLTREVSIRDPSNTLNRLSYFQMSIRDINYQPMQPAFAKKLLNDAVSQSQCHLPEDMLTQGTQQVAVGNYVFQKFSSTPWFEDYRNIFFQVFYPSNHEFFHHYLACIFVVSSSSAQPLDDIVSLLQEQQAIAQNPASTTKWFFTNILKYFVLLHDVGEGDTKKAEEVFQRMKGLYGASVCHFLQINSFSDSLEGSFTDSDTSSTHNPWVRKTFPEKPSTEVDATAKLSVPRSSSFSKPVVSEDNLMESSTEDILSGNESTCSGDAALSHPLVLDMENPSPTSFKEDLFSEVSSYSGPTRSEPSQQKTPGACLTASDIERIQTFAFEFCTNGLFPFVESQMRILNEQVANRKGLHRSLFSATKKWLASGKQGVQNPSAVQNTVVYNSDAPELQVRRLGDLAFMFQLYELAYQAYHTAKREFSTDQAWLHFAGALEMAALSVFMQGLDSPRQYPLNYMELAITTYLTTCKSLQLATRATLLSVECLKSKGLFNEAAAHLIRLTSEDSDLRSALLLEQAALCFLNGRPPFPRKYAFHMVLAGHRFSKAGHKKHALRTYKLAHQVYQRRGWRISEDHINYTMGRLSITLGQLAGASEAYRSLLLEESLQPQLQQFSILKDYVNVLKHLSVNSPDAPTLPVLPVPVLDPQSSLVFLGNNLESAGNVTECATFGDKMWLRLEELAMIRARGSLPFNHKPQLQCLSCYTDNTYKALSAVDEMISVCLPVRNVLHIPVTICNVCLLWKFIPDSADQQEITNEQVNEAGDQACALIETHVVSKLILQPLQAPNVYLSLKPRAVGELHITGVAYDLYASREDSLDTTQSSSENEDSNGGSASKKSTPLFVRGRQELSCRGPRLNTTKAEKVDKVYAPDFRFNIIITPPMPRLKVEFSGFPKDLLCGELYEVQATFHNLGKCSLTNLFVASPTPELFSFGSAEKGDLPLDRVGSIPRANAQEEPLESKDSFESSLWIRGPDTPGQHNLDFLFYYEVLGDMPISVRHRILCHRMPMSVKPSLVLRAMVSKNWDMGTYPENPTDTRSFGGLNIDLQVENLCEPKNSMDLKLCPVQVCGSSSKWSIKPLNPDKILGGSCLGPRETVHIILKAVPWESSTEGETPHGISTIALGRDVQMDPTRRPCADFLQRSQLKLPALVPDAYEVPSQAEAPTDVPDDDVGCSDPSKLLMRAELSSTKIDLLLVVIWKLYQNTDSGSLVTTGQHHLMITNVDVMHSSELGSEQPKDVYEPVQQIPYEVAPAATVLDPLIQGASSNNGSLKKMLNFVLQHPTRIDHKFNESRLCIVPVELIAHNCCQVQLAVHIDTTKPGSSSEYDLVGLSPCSSPTTYRGPATTGFMWIGPTQLYTTVTPGGVVHISLKAAFTAPGMYNLTNMAVSACPSFAEDVTIPSAVNDMYVVQQSLSPSLIVVGAAS